MSKITPIRSKETLRSMIKHLAKGKETLEKSSPHYIDENLENRFKYSKEEIPSYHVAYKMLSLKTCPDDNGNWTFKEEDQLYH